MSHNINALVQRATEPNNEMEDWDTFLQISDLLIQRPDETCDNVCSQVFKAMSAPHPRTRYFGVALLDSCVKNSNQFFQQSLLRHPKTAQLNSLLKNDSDMSVVEKWDEVSDEWKRNYSVLYDTAMGKANHNANATTATTAATTAAFAPTSYYANLPPPPSQHQHQQQQQQQQPHSINLPPTPSIRTGSDTMDHDQNKKKKTERILDDLKVVEENCALLSSFIEHAESGRLLRSDEAVQQIHANMEEMNRRLMILIERVPDEELLMKSLEVHELLFATLDNYKHYLSTGEKRKIPVRSESPATQTLNSAPTTSQNLLDDIDLFFDSAPPVVVNKGKSPMSMNQPSQERVESMSLDDFLSQPSVAAASSSSSSYSNPAYDPFQMDSMESELNRVHQQEQQSSSNSGFAALARRKTQSHTSPNPFALSPEAEPNPFAVEEQSIPQPKLFTPRGSDNNTESMYPVTNSSGSAPPLQEDTATSGSGFAALARRNKNKKVSPTGDAPPPPTTGDFFLE